MSSIHTKTKFIAHTALYLALAVLLPLGFHAVGLGGKFFLPMHIPVLLAGFLLGRNSGLIVGLLAPAISFLLTGMPPAGMLPIMSVELPLYGFLAGTLYKNLKMNVILSLVITMLIGRLMFGLGLLLLGLIFELKFGVAAFWTAIVTGLPGLGVQLVVIPLTVAAVNRGKTE